MFYVLHIMLFISFTMLAYGNEESSPEKVTSNTQAVLRAVDEGDVEGINTLIQSTQGYERFTRNEKLTILQACWDKQDPSVLVHTAHSLEVDLSRVNVNIDEHKFSLQDWVNKHNSAREALLIMPSDPSEALRLLESFAHIPCHLMQGDKEAILVESIKSKNLGYVSQISTILGLNPEHISLQTVDGNMRSLAELLNQENELNQRMQSWFTYWVDVIQNGPLQHIEHHYTNGLPRALTKPEVEQAINVARQTNDLDKTCLVLRLLNVDPRSCSVTLSNGDFVSFYHLMQEKYAQDLAIAHANAASHTSTSCVEELD